MIDSAISTKFYSFIDLKEFDKAIDVANHRPSMWNSKDFLLYSAYRGREANNHIQKMILILMDQLSSYIFSLTYKLKGGDDYSITEKIIIIKTAISIIDTVIDDKNYLFYSVRLSRFYTFLGLYFAKLDNANEMYESLEKAKELAQYYDSLEQNEKYTSINVNSYTYHPNETAKNAEWTDFEVFKDILKREEFDEFRTLERFIRLNE